MEAETAGIEREDVSRPRYEAVSPPGSLVTARTKSARLARPSWSVSTNTLKILKGRREGRERYEVITFGGSWVCGGREDEADLMC